MRDLTLPGVIAALEAQDCDPVKNGKGWHSRCPAHDDHNPSLTIAKGKKQRVLLMCHRGCTFDEIVAALPKRKTIFKRKPKARQNRKQIARYLYRNADKTLVGRVLRYRPKSFIQERWTGKRFVPGLKGLQLPLYHLPAVLNAIAAGETIWIPEGEKDVRALERAGVVATTNAGGAETWRADHTATLHGAAKAVVVADRDEPGRKRARKIAADLEAIGVPTTIVEAKDGKDAFDHFEAKHGLEDFVPIPVDDWTPSNLEGVTDPRAGEVEWFARDLLPVGGTLVVSAAWKTAKTLLAYRIALDLARGKHVLRHFMVKGAKRVLIFQLEMPPREDNRRFRRLAIGSGIDPAEIVRLVRDGKLVLYNRVPLDLLSAEGQQHFHAVVRRHNADIVVVDSALAACSLASTGDEPMNSNSTVRQMFTKAFLPLTSEGRSIIVLTHFRKRNGKTDDSRGAMLGAQAWGAAADLIVSLERIAMKAGEKRKDNGFACRLSPVGGWTPESMRDLVVCVRDDSGGTVIEILDHDAQLGAGGITRKDRARVALLSLVRKEPGIAQKDAISRLTETEHATRTVEDVIAELVAADEVRQEQLTGHGKNAKALYPMGEL